MDRALRGILGQLTQCSVLTILNILHLSFSLRSVSTVCQLAQVPVIILYVPAQILSNSTLADVSDIELFTEPYVCICDLQCVDD